MAQALTYALPRHETLSPAARTLLLVMCHHAKDNDRNPAYFAGSAYLARTLGYPVATDQFGRESASDAGKTAVKRALRELVKAGYIDQIEGLARTWKRRWLLTLPGLAVLEGGAASEGTRVTPHEGTRVTPQRGHG